MSKSPRKHYYICTCRQSRNSRLIRIKAISRVNNKIHGHPLLFFEEKYSISRRFPVDKKTEKAYRQSLSSWTHLCPYHRWNSVLNPSLFHSKTTANLLPKDPPFWLPSPIYFFHQSERAYIGWSRTMLRHRLTHQLNNNTLSGSGLATKSEQTW